MNRFSRAAVLSLSILGLAACATTDDQSMSADPQSSTIGPDREYMSVVEQMALRRGIEVMWVNPPMVEETELVAQHEPR